LSLLDKDKDKKYIEVVEQCVVKYPVRAEKMCQAAHRAFVCIRIRTRKQAIYTVFQNYYNTNATELTHELLSQANSTNDLKFRNE
jgi:Fe-S cluster assembly scaffold protein SufB